MTYHFREPKIRVGKLVLTWVNMSPVKGMTRGELVGVTTEGQMGNGIQEVCAMPHRGQDVQADAEG